MIMRNFKRQNNVKRPNKKRNIGKNKLYRRRDCRNYISKFKSGNKVCLTLLKNTVQNLAAKKYWKVLPKDSCEVYKDRQRRYQNETEDDEREDINQSGPSSTQEKRKRSRSRREKKSVSNKNNHSKRRRYEKKRLHRKISLISNSTITDASQSTNYYCNSDNSSINDMEYDT